MIHPTERRLVQLVIPDDMIPVFDKDPDGSTRVSLSVEVSTQLYIPQEWFAHLEALGLQEPDVSTEFENFTHRLTLRSVFNRITK